MVIVHISINPSSITSNVIVTFLRETLVKKSTTYLTIWCEPSLKIICEQLAATIIRPQVSIQSAFFWEVVEGNEFQVHNSIHVTDTSKNKLFILHFLLFFRSKCPQG